MLSQIKPTSFNRMKSFVLSLLSLLLFTAHLNLNAQTSGSFNFSGQASGWVNVNPANESPLWMGARYIPQINYGIHLNKHSLIDFELSANINGNTGVIPLDEFSSEGNIKPYRAWTRYSSTQFELRLGLQKINFGSASMIRPLMWFDQMDPRDPLQLTDGVWGLLGRYWFLNNMNIWLWGLYGNDDPKTWEIGSTSEGTPEFGGRFQMPVPRGEAGLSFHHRKVNLRSLGFDYQSFRKPGINNLADRLPLKSLMYHNIDYADFHGMETLEGPENFEEIPENRFGFDAKWDVEIGLWVEAALINKTRDIGQLTNQHLLTLGADYTFGIGNGVNLILEQVMISTDQRAFNLENRNNFTAFSLSYPLGIFDNVNAIIYRDWTNDNTYSFINWQRQFNRVSLYLMAFWNPDTFQLPQQSESTLLFSGRGFQFMLVFNH